MRQDELLLAVLGIAILLNVLLITASWLHSRNLRRSRAGAAHAPPGEPVGPSVTPFSPGDREDDGRVAAAVEAFVAGVAPDAAGSARIPTPAEVLARRQEVTGAGRAAMTAVHLGSASGSSPDPDEDAEGRRPLRHTGLAESPTWEEMVRDESARAARFRRPSMVVTASLPQLGDIAERWGREAADRVAAETARLLESEARAVDRIARLSDATFGILLPETGEQGATRYAERVRAAADAWLNSAGLSVRLDLEWATVPNGADADAGRR